VHPGPPAPGTGPPSWGAPDPYAAAYYAQFAPKPGCVPLRPLTLSDILDGSFQTIRRNPRSTLGLSAVIAVLQVSVLAIFQVVVYSVLRDTNSNSSDPNQVGAGQLLGVLSSLFSVIVLSAVFGAVLTGMLTHVITQDVLGNRETLGSVWNRVRPRLVALIGASFLVAMLQLIGLVLFIVPGVWLWGALTVTVPALMVENIGVRAAMKRSRALVRGTFWRVWGIRALGAVIVAVISGIAAAPFSILAIVVSGQGLGDLSDGNAGLPIAYLLITSIGAILTTTFTAPIKAGIDALLYVDLRMRKEGLDIALQQAVANRMPPPGPRY